MNVKVIWHNAGNEVDLAELPGELTIDVAGEELRARAIRLVINTPDNRVEYAGRVGLSNVERGSGAALL